jgi:hypothetical protein
VNPYPVALDGGEHCVGLIGQAALADNRHRVGDVLGDLLADSERRDRERNKHLTLFCMISRINDKCGMASS